MLLIQMLWMIPDVLDDMSLAKFAVTYDVGNGNTSSDSHENDDSCNESDDDINDYLDVNHVDSNVSSWKNEVIILKNGLGHMRKQRQQSILRVTSFKMATQPEKYYHSRLILYLPW